MMTNLLIGFMLLCMSYNPKGNEVIYPKVMTVTDYTADTIICVDTRENEWSFYCTDLYKGKQVGCVMSDNETPDDITDDIILDVYSLN